MSPRAAAEAAATFPPGARVEIRDEEWIVRSARAVRSGGLAVQVTGVSELVEGRDATFLTDLDPVVLLAPEETALVPDTSSRFLHTRLTLEALLRRSPATDAAIHLAHTAAIDVAHYQLRPAARALSLIRPRFLMADGVGLGKTIEVGALLTELIRRGRGRRILVVCMKSILAQFQEELWARFTIPLVRLDSVGIRRVAADIPASMNPFHVFDRVIISLDTLKNPRYERYLEGCRFDAIVIDECQNVAMRTKSLRGSASQRYELARLLAKQCDSLILTSATPHDGSPKSFASIIRLLEPTAIADVEDFTAEDVSHFVQRKFKKDVAHEQSEVFPERETHSRHLLATPAEDAVFEALDAARFQTTARRASRQLVIDGTAREASGGVLFRTTLLKAFLSSPEACIQTLDARLGHNKVREDPKEPRDPAAEAAAAADRTTRSELKTLCQAAAGRGPKYTALLERIREVLAQDTAHHDTEAPPRIVVFAERIRTLETLQAQLAKDLSFKLKPKKGKSAPLNPIEIFSGQLDDQDQMAIVKSFGTADSPIRVLLCSDAAAEGINLHYHCAALVHFDLPWSLITLVQRNGRIDRFGQRRTPRIDYLLTRPSRPDLAGDLRVLNRLIEKEDQVQRNLGDPATLMNLGDPELESDRIAAAAQGDIAPEEALPDAPPEEVDIFTEIFGDAVPEDEVPLELREPRSLFASDLDFARDAVALLDERPGQDPVDVVWQPDHSGFDLVPPPDLERRYEHLPRELTRGRTRLRLTTDRSLVMRSMELARQAKGQWPEWELFWAHHPVLQWLDDQVLGVLGRHEAWVVESPEGVAPDDVLFLFQGLLANHASQPVLVDWFAVPFRGGAAGDPVPLDEVMQRTGFETPRGNPGRGHVPASLHALRAPAVEAARAHMTAQRLARAADIGEPLRQGMRELQAWRDKVRARLDAELARLGTEGGPQAKRLRAQRAEADALFNERKGFIERLKTQAAPYVRLVAAFTAPGLSSDLA